MLGFWLVGSMAALASAPNFTHERLLAQAAAHSEWSQTDVIRQLEIIRDLALSHDTSSNPVSDRYSLTFYGGPIDWVHFLNLAIFLTSGDQEFGQAQYDQWVSEGGPDFEAGRNATHPSAATPDDLPSNAFGALFGRELRESSETDVAAALRTFIQPLRPVPDTIAKQFSRDTAVLGLPKNPSSAQLDRAWAWFTAEPGNLTRLINRKSLEIDGREFGKATATGREALEIAGFRLLRFRGKPVVIDFASR